MKINNDIRRIAALSVVLIISSVSIGSAGWFSSEARGPITNSSNNCSYICWNCSNWSPLYFDINNQNSSTEILYYQNLGNRTNPDIGGTNCVIDEGELVYSTGVYSKEYKASTKGGAAKLGSYSLIPWMCNKYVAVAGDAGKITPIVFEQDSNNKQTLKTGQVWELGNNYSLLCNRINLEGTKAWLSLYKDGKELKSDIVCTEGSPDNRTFVAKGDFAGISDAIFFITYIENALPCADDNESIIEFKYTWLIDKDNITTIEVGDKFGELECTEASLNSIKLSNPKRIELKIDGDTNLTEDMYIRSSALMPRAGRVSKIRYYFYPVKAYTMPDEKYELRGRVSNTSLNESLFWNNSMWNSFYFNVKGPEDSVKYSEILYYQNKESSAHNAINVTNTGNVAPNNIIDENELIYSANVYNKTYRVKLDHFFEVHKVDMYPAIHWMCNCYIAIGGDARYITPTVVEQRPEEEKILKIGEVWNMGKNYSLVCKQFDEEGGKVLVSVYKQGKELDSGILNINGTIDDRILVLKADFAGKKDVIYFVTYVDKAFKSDSNNFIKLMGTWLIDKENVTTIEVGDKFGEMECTEASEKLINLSNSNTLTLELDNKTYFTDEMYFKTSKAHEDGGFLIYPGKEMTVSSSSFGKPWAIYSGEISQDPANASKIVAVDLAPPYNGTGEVHIGSKITNTTEENITENKSSDRESTALKAPGFGVTALVSGIFAGLFFLRKQDF